MGILSPGIDRAIVVDLQQVVGIVLYILVAGVVFGLLFFLVDYVGRQFPGEGSAMFTKLAKIVLIVLAVLVIIGIVIGLAGGGQMFRWGPAQPAVVVR